MENPKRFTAVPKLDLATLIREDLASHVVALRPTNSSHATGLTGNGKVGGKGIEGRMKARKEAQGDYSRFVGEVGKGGHAERARRILISNSSIGLNGREFLVGKVEQLIRR
jgi:hypothetical protein